MVNRRFFMRGAAVLGCSIAAHPWLSTVTLASGAARLGDNRLIVIILRGAMDGLDVVQPVGDPLFAKYRPVLGAQEGVAALNGYFGLHPALAGLLPLWQKQQLAFVHAASTPYRNKRSHFDGQDILEAGTGFDVPVPEVRDGWLNRMLQNITGIEAETAYSIGRDALPLLLGSAPVRDWAPDQQLPLSAQAKLLLEQIYHDDPLFQNAAQEAMEITAGLSSDNMSSDNMASGDPAEEIPKTDKEARKMADIDRLAQFAVSRLQGVTRIAAFSLPGWDTHRNQADGLGRSLQRLERLILQLQAGLGDLWGKTAVLAMTEFGRTVAENGTGGTDHGTGGAMLMAGGAIKGGQIYGHWPGLAENALYERRDLMPTGDVRAWAAWVMRGLYGFDRAVLESAIFPQLQMGDDPKVIL